MMCLMQWNGWWWWGGSSFYLCPQICLYFCSWVFYSEIWGYALVWNFRLQESGDLDNVIRWGERGVTASIDNANCTIVWGYIWSLRVHSVGICYGRCLFSTCGAAYQGRLLRQQWCVALVCPVLTKFVKLVGSLYALVVLCCFQLHLSDLELDYHARDKFIRLVGDCYKPDTDEIVFMSDRYVVSTAVLVCLFIILLFHICLCVSKTCSCLVVFLQSVCIINYFGLVVWLALVRLGLTVEKGDSLFCRGHGNVSLIV